MKNSEATALIRTPIIGRAQPQSWCDLGCGSGTFTTALAQLLASGSTIHSVDLDKGALERIPDQYHGVTIRKVLGDLRSSSLRLPSADGILMANSLHFIEDQHLLLKKLLSVTGRFLIVEYERSRPTPSETVRRHGGRVLLISSMKRQICSYDEWRSAAGAGLWWDLHPIGHEQPSWTSRYRCRLKTLFTKSHTTQFSETEMVRRFDLLLWRGESCRQLRVRWYGSLGRPNLMCTCRNIGVLGFRLDNG
jgi:SAM-dependent methyltransferase